MPLAIIMHPITLFKELPLLVKIAGQLRDMGYATLRFDFPGHGESDGALEEITLTSAGKAAEFVAEEMRKNQQFSSFI